MMKTNDEEYDAHQNDNDQLQWWKRQQFKQIYRISTTILCKGENFVDFLQLETHIIHVIWQTLLYLQRIHINQYTIFSPALIHTSFQS